MIQTAQTQPAVEILKNTQMYFAALIWKAAIFYSFFVKTGLSCPVVSEEHTLESEDFSMTDQQKDQIQTMRRQGLSYVKIGQALGISDNTVRSFCRRNRVVGSFPDGNFALMRIPMPMNSLGFLSIGTFL